MSQLYLYVLMALVVILAASVKDRRVSCAILISLLCVTFYAYVMEKTRADALQRTLQRKLAQESEFGDYRYMQQKAR